MWRVTDDDAAYPAWLKEIYGADNAPQRNGWISYNDILPKLAGWNVKDFDASQLMDQWTFNDSYWNNFIGDLVDYANCVDPDTPCGFVGGQGANAFGGYDWPSDAQDPVHRELQRRQSIIRSFNPHNALPIVTTHFFNEGRHGRRHLAGLVQPGPRQPRATSAGWRTGSTARTPKPWHARRRAAPTTRPARRSAR